MDVGQFSLSPTVRQRTSTSASEWCKRYGSQTPNMKLIDIKMYSLTCSSSGCEFKWGTFQHVVKGETQPNLVFDGEDLSWLDVDIASGVAQPISNTRRKASLHKEVQPTPPQSLPPFSSRSMSRTKEVVVVEGIDVDQEYIKEDEEEVDNENEEKSSGKENSDEYLNFYVA
ncbi:hypothetical protein KIW84_057630 [Lathyrus oleraceus]|uniref:Uncharacterized protein n=1 Tax=Pisum sativum TaxID=3888 RepID=A0A9D5AMV7_PEA|nr:hypothetical protein KIW84_057630 [Pisum sativum]